MEFKRTLQLTSDGDLKLDQSNRVGMIDSVPGVVQELKVTLKTVRGEDPFAPEHGLRLTEIAGAPEAVLEREIRFALNADDRVASVVDVRVDDTDERRNREVLVTVQLVDESTDTTFGVTVG